MKHYTVSWILCCMLFLSCERKMAETTHEEGEGQREETTLVSLSDEQLAAGGIEMGTVELKNLTTSLSVNGTLEVPNQNKAFVTSLVSGVVQQLHIQPGDHVKKGQVIATIANTQLSEVQQQLIAVGAQLDYAEQEHRRQQELVAGDAAPKKNLEKAKADLSGLRAQKTALQRQLTTLGGSSSGAISNSLIIKAPISGTISDITAQIGSQVDANSPIAQIINNSELHLDLFVYEKDLPKLASGQTIHFTLTNDPGKEYDAKIYSIGTAFVKETKAVPVHAHVINEKTGLIEGMSVTARISLGENVYPAVPDEAIVTHQGKDYLFVPREEGAKHTSKEAAHDHGEEGHSHEDEKHTDKKARAFERIQVIKGASDVGYTEIKPVTPLPAGSKIVTKGAFFLMAALTNTGGHQH